MCSGRSVAVCGCRTRRSVRPRNRRTSRPRTRTRRPAKRRWGPVPRDGRGQVFSKRPQHSRVSSTTGRAHRSGGEPRGPRHLRQDDRRSIGRRGPWTIRASRRERERVVTGGKRRYVKGPRAVALGPWTPRRRPELGTGRGRGSGGAPRSPGSTVAEDPSRDEDTSRRRRPAGDGKRYPARSGRCRSDGSGPVPAVAGLPPSGRADARIRDLSRRDTVRRPGAAGSGRA